MKPGNFKYIFVDKIYEQDNNSYFKYSKGFSKIFFGFYILGIISNILFYGTTILVALEKSLAPAIIILILSVISVVVLKPIIDSQYQKKKSIYINCIVELEDYLKVVLLDGTEVSFEYKQLQEIETWKKSEFVMEDKTTGRRYIFTRNLANPEGRSIWRENGKFVICFNKVKAIIEEKIANAQKL